MSPFNWLSRASDSDKAGTVSNADQPQKSIVTLYLEGVLVPQRRQTSNRCKSRAHSRLAPCRSQDIRSNGTLVCSYAEIGQRLVHADEHVGSPLAGNVPIR